MKNVKVIKGDITDLKVDVIVNPANVNLTPGSGGVCAAIHRVAGPELAEECANIQKDKNGLRCAVGEVQWTPGFGLKAKSILHTVAPKWKDGEVEGKELLTSCYRSCLHRDFYKSKMAFPSLGTGKNGIPVDVAAKIAAKEICLHAHAHPLNQYVMCAFSDSDYQIYKRTFESVEEDIDNALEWEVEIFGECNENNACLDADVVFNCRNAGTIKNVKVLYYVDNYPYFTLYCRIAGRDVCLGHKHSYMAWNGGIDFSSLGDGETQVFNLMSNYLTMPVYNNGRLVGYFDQERIRKMCANARTREVWMTDPRMLYFAYCALADNPDKIAEMVKVKPSISEAIRILMKYRLLPSRLICHGNHDGQEDCYPYFGMLQADMQKFGAKIFQK